MLTSIAGIAALVALASFVGLVPMVVTEWSSTEWPVFSAIIWSLVFTVIGLIISIKVKIDNFVVLMILIFGLGSAIINTALGAAVGGWAFDAIAAANDAYRWGSAILVILVIFFSVRAILKHRNAKAPYVILLIIGLASMFTVPGAAIADVVSYLLQVSLAGIFDAVGWTTNEVNLEAPWN